MQRGRRDLAYLRRHHKSPGKQSGTFLQNEGTGWGITDLCILGFLPDT